MSTTIDVTTRYMIWACASCGVSYGVTEDFDDRRRNDHKTFYCPNGHGQSYSADNAEEKLRKEKKRLEQRLANEEEYARSIAAARELEKRAHAVTKGKLTKAKKRAANGVCPCCSRSFANVQRHIESQHPEHVAEVNA